MKGSLWKYQKWQKVTLLASLGDAAEDQIIHRYLLRLLEWSDLHDNALVKCKNVVRVDLSALHCSRSSILIIH